MAHSSQTTTTTLTMEEQEQLLHQEVVIQARLALGENTPFWSGILNFIDWLRGMVRNALRSRLVNLPVVGRWAERLSTSISEFIFSVIGTMLHFMKIVFSSTKVWGAAHAAALAAWASNEERGLLTQCYAYGRKMAGYFLEIIKQCLERAIKAHGLEVTTEEAKDISNMLDSIV